MNLLIKNIGELFDGSRIIKNTCIYIEDGIIKSIGKKEKADEIIDAEKKFVMPGFVDCHTHTVFAGYREFEIEWKIEGLSYQEIARRGGGIKYTVEETKKASKERLKKESKERIKEMITHGTTTLEIKSGYGLDEKNEIKILEVINELKKEEKIDIVPTFLAHAIPEDMTADEYVEYIIEEILPKASKLAKFCDVFCEKGYFDIKQSMKILREAKKYGMDVRIHADEFSCMGCSKLAAEIGAVSADHLLMAGEEEIKEMAKKKVIATLLPAVPFVLNTNYPNARKMLQNGLEIALATDFNPNCYITNMQFIIQLSCYKMRMKPLEALRSSTLISAKSLKMNNIGSIQEGKQADLIIMDIPSYLFIPYKVGTNLVRMVIKRGEIIYQSE